MSLYPNEFGEPGKAPNDPQSTTLNDQFLEKVTSRSPVVAKMAKMATLPVCALSGNVTWQCDSLGCPRSNKFDGTGKA